MARALTGALTGLEVAAAAFEQLVEMGCSSAGLWLVDSGTIRFVGGSGTTDVIPDRVAVIPLESDLPAALAVREGRIVTYRSRRERDERWPELTAVGGTSEATAVLPLLAAGRALGCLHLGYPAGAGSDQLDQPFLEALADLCAAALDRARLHDAHREVAHTLQRLLLPSSLPAVAGVEIAARYLTARSDAEAGGDFYDVVVLPSGRIGFVIGDVEGHDPEAAAVMGQLRSAIRALAGQTREPDQLIDAVRWSWDLLGFERMATCLVGRLDPADGTTVTCSAGHVPPVVVGTDGAVRMADVHPAPPLGAPAGPSVALSTRLAPGETLFMYTDGVMEAGRSGIDAELGRLRAVLAASRGSLDAMCDAVVAELPEPKSRTDDVALLAIRRTGGWACG